MTEPASTPSINITAARGADLAAVLQLEQTGFPVDERWSERSWSGELVADGRKILIARAHRVLGVVSLAVNGPTADLHRIVVAPTARRQGVGRQLLAAGVEAVRHAGVRSVILEVRYDNEPAIALYQDFGFEQLGARPDYYGPGETALILKLYDVQTRSEQETA